jgi:hypothetical protein
MTGERNIEEDLKSGTSDYVYVGVKAGLSTIPVYGGVVTNLLTNIIPSPLEKRRSKWFVDFDKRLQLLEKTVEGFSSKRLAENENFISMFFYATTIAIRTHQEIKLESLRNAVTNSILHPEIDESLQLMFLNLIDRYTPWHLVLLQFSNDPREYQKQQGIKQTFQTRGPLSPLIEETFPELKLRDDFVSQIIKQLISDGLMPADSYIHGGMTEIGMSTSSRTTEMGKQFLRFIRNPIADQTKKE